MKNSSTYALRFWTVYGLACTAIYWIARLVY
jgi:hypothetical protein